MFEMLRPALHPSLHLVEGIHVYDRLVGAGGVVHRLLPMVDDAFLRDVVLPVGPLQEQVPGVCVIAEQLQDKRCAACI